MGNPAGDARRHVARRMELHSVGQRKSYLKTATITYVHKEFTSIYDAYNSIVNI